MTENNNGPELARVFAPMLDELEEHATRLTQRQAELARELAAVDEELQRVEAVRAAMAGTNPKRRSSATGEGRKRTRQTVRTDAIRTWLREQGGEHVGKDIADAVGIPHQSVGPILGGMTRRGEVKSRDDAPTGARFYSIA